MSQNHENKASESEISYDVLWSTLQSYLVKGADEIRQKLGLNEERYDLMSRAHNGRGRNHYIYGILDEIEQIAMMLVHSQEELREPLEKQIDDEIERRLFRNRLALIERQQSLHIRRLLEILVELINFSQTNSNPYYDHYLLYKELSQRNRRKHDLDKYFNCENLNNNSAMQFLKTSISWAENKLDINKCWYLQGGPPKTQGNSKLQKNFELLFDRALIFATKNEKLRLGFSYSQFYRETSQVIHLNIGSIKCEPSFESLRLSQHNIVYLAMHCLFRCYKLIGVFGTRKHFHPRALQNDDIVI